MAQSVLGTRRVADEPIARLFRTAETRRCAAPPRRGHQAAIRHEPSALTRPLSAARDPRRTSAGDPFAHGDASSSIGLNATTKRRKRVSEVPTGFVRASHAWQARALATGATQ